MDWSKLKHLSVDSPSKSFLEAFHNQLTGLESFTLGPSYGPWGDNFTLCELDEAIDQLRLNYTSFITAMPPLHFLSIHGTGRLLDLEPILKTHGSSLRHFSLHEYERDCENHNGFWSRPALSAAQVRHLKNAGATPRDLGARHPP